MTNPSSHRESAEKFFDQFRHYLSVLNRDNFVADLAAEFEAVARESVMAVDELTKGRCSDCGKIIDN